MELKKSLAAFSDRELLEIVLLNQVQFERRLERIELHLQKSYNRVSEYINASGNLDGRQEGYTYSKAFEELVTKSHSAKSLINEYLKKEDSEINW